jgi:hypothetical protein
MTRQIMKLTAGSVVAMAVLISACGGGRAPVYSLQPTETPLRYSISTEGSQTVETPNGPAGGGYETEAVVLLSFGDAVNGGSVFAATFDSFESTLDSQMGQQQVDGSSLTGHEFRGIVGPAGAIEMTEKPELKAGAYDQNSLAAMFSDLFAPLPPGGEPVDGGWPHAFVLPSGGGLDGETSYAGTARFVGDTTWNGIAARVIVSEGTVHADGTGTPQGAPGEIELVADGDARAVYVWDPETGILLAMKVESHSDGIVTTMGFDLPLALVSTREARLER